MDLVCQGVDGVILCLDKVGLGEVAVVEEGTFNVSPLKRGLCEVSLIEVALLQPTLSKGGPFHLQVGKITTQYHTLLTTDREELRVTSEEIEGYQLARIKKDLLQSAAIQFDEGELTLHKPTIQE